MRCECGWLLCEGDMEPSTCLICSYCALVTACWSNGETTPLGPYAMALLSPGLRVWIADKQEQAVLPPSREVMA